MDAIRLLNLGTVPFLQSQSIYHCIAETMDDQTPDTIVLLAPREPYLCVGYHQQVDTRLDLGACRYKGVPILRRKLGGGAVYLDNDQLFYQCIFNRTRTPARVDAMYDRFLSAPVSVLQQLGISAELKPPNEIEVRGKRIAGTGAGQIRDATVVVGNILFDFPREKMIRLWQAPSESFRSLVETGLKNCLTTLKEELPRPPSMGVVTALLVDAYSAALNREIVQGELTERESHRLASIGAQLGSPEWVHKKGSVANDTLKVSARVSVREDEVQLNGSRHRFTVRMLDGAIDDIVLDPPLEDLQAAFRGWHPDGPIDQILASNPHLHAEHEMLNRLREWSAAPLP